MSDAAEQLLLLEKLQVFKIQGRDKLGRRLLRVIGKVFPARIVSVDVVKRYLEEKIYRALESGGPFSVLYIHTGVHRSENFPGIAALRSIYEAVPVDLKNNLEAVYFVHPDLHARLFLATVGRLMFNSRLYGKVRYASRLDSVWREHVRRSEVELPEFVYEHDEELEYRPMMDYGIESDHPRVYYGAPSVDSPVAMYSMRVKGDG
ncbi:GDAP2-like protein [Drosera capensis]